MTHTDAHSARQWASVWAEDLLRDADERARAGDYGAALTLRQRAFAVLRADGDIRRSARLAAYDIAFDHAALFGNTAVARGWLERGIHLAAESGPCVEAGWVAMARALHAVDAEERDRWIGAAGRIADEFGDDDLHFDALAYRGLAMVEAGRVTDGMRRLDEAAAAAYSGEVASRVVAGEIYCKLMVACETVLDVPRADQWHRVFADLEEPLDIAWAAAICRMHTAAVWTAAGRWEEAEQELSRSIALYDVTYRALRPAACARLAELRVRQGRMEEAEQLLRDSGDDSFGVRPAARVAWARALTGTERDAVVATLVEALEPRGEALAAVPVLALLAELQRACGRADAATETAASLTAIMEGDVGEALTGYACLAAGLVSTGVAETEAGHLLRRAIRCFAAARLPLEEARARAVLARSVAGSQPAMALSEAQQAADTFGRLGADDDLHEASAIVRSLGGRTWPSPRTDDLLSSREHEVLLLVAQGLSNPEIADRLYLSRTTVAHHVSNVLAKLGVRNRGEAAAWFAQQSNTAPHGAGVAPSVAQVPARSTSRARRSRL